MLYKNLIDHLRNKSILILGFGLEGQSSYRFIRRHIPEAEVCIADQRDISGLVEPHKNTVLVTGPDYLKTLYEYEIILKSPGISLKDQDLSLIKGELTSQLDLFLRMIPVKTVGVTGTKGKSTTVSLIKAICDQASLPVMLLGNIGVPVFESLDDIKQDTAAVIEMSSHQLEYITVSPDIAVLTNLYEEHLDHYRSFEHYIKAKLNIGLYQNKHDFLIYNYDLELLREQVKVINRPCKWAVTLEEPHKTEHIRYCTFVQGDDLYFIIDGRQELAFKVPKSSELKGRHNIMNILFAATVCKILGCPAPDICRAVDQFNGLPHRMEFIGEVDGVRYYNDSIATIPEAVIYAVEALKDVKTLIIGGMDRGINYDPFCDYLKKSDVQNIICLPETGHKIAEKLAGNNTSKNVVKVADLPEAVRVAKMITPKGSICLLSPAAASYGFFKNFSERGETFKNLVLSRS